MISISGRIHLPFTVAICSIYFAGILVPNVPAQEVNELTSAKLAPVDADFYSVSLRLPEQWDRFISGPVVKEFLELSAVENAWEQFRSDWSERDGIGLNARIFFENPNTQDALAFMKELSASEVFMFGDKNVLCIGVFKKDSCVQSDAVPFGPIGTKLLPRVFDGGKFKKFFDDRPRNKAVPLLP